MKETAGILGKDRISLYTIFQLIYADFQSRYKRSFIGSLWLLIEPLMSVVIWVFLFYTGIIRPGNSDISYAGYVLLSTSLWNIFNSSFNDTSSVLKSYQKILLSIRNTPSLFVLTKIILSYIYSIVPMITILVFLIFTDVSPTSWWLLSPIVVLPLLLIGSSLGMINALLSVVSVDISKLARYAIQVLKYLTPIIYTPSVDSAILKTATSYNPLSNLIGYPRDLIIGSQHYALDSFLLITCCSILLFSICTWYFVNKSKIILERTIV